MGSIISSEAINEAMFSNYLQSKHFRKIITKKSDLVYYIPTIYKSIQDHSNIAVIQLPLKKSGNNDKIITQINYYKSNPHKNIINIVEFSEKTLKTSLFTSKKEISILAEYHFYTLLNNLESLARKGLFYDESEIWYILISLIKALYYLKTNSAYHSNIKLDTITITSDGELKIFPNHLFGKQASGFYQMKNYLTKDYDYCYLSPELLKYLDQNTKIKRSWKHDIFSIGILAVELCTLKNAKCCFDFEKLLLDHEKIRAFLENIQENYSMSLAKIIGKLLNYEKIDDDFLNEILNDIERMEFNYSIRISPNLLNSLKNSAKFTIEEVENPNE
mgnify:CR=1 FL=1